MTKLETVRALNDTGPQLQIVESIRTLQQAVTLMHEDLNQLPDAISEQTAQALAPLERLRQEVLRIAEAYDQITATQRQALDQMAQEMTGKAAQAFGQKVQTLDQSLHSLTQSAASLRSSIDSLNETAKRIEGLPDRLSKAQQSMTQASAKLIEAADETRQNWWYQLLMLIFAGMIGAATIGIGQSVLNRLVPPSAVQQQANWARAVWNNATPQERLLLNRIASQQER